MLIGPLRNGNKVADCQLNYRWCFIKGNIFRVSNVTNLGKGFSVTVIELQVF